jgi:tripartite-type tricarboxylate transporter receptor subunit TctC
MSGIDSPHQPKRRALLAMAGAAVIARPAIAQSRFPDRPIRLVVPWLPGSAADSELRALSQAAGSDFGQSIVIENKAGASGILGAQMIAAEKRSDGYLLTQMHTTAFRMTALMDKPAYDVLHDYSWIIQLVGYSYGTVVRADSRWNNWSEFVAYSKANPGKVTLGTAGVGTTQHITMMQVAKKLGIEWLHIPFRGGGDEAQALLGGQIDAVASSTYWAELVKAGKLRLLVTFGVDRVKRFPDVPTLRESGVDIAQIAPYGLVAPRGLDPDIKRILHDGFKKALYTPAHLAAIERLDMPLAYLDSEDYEKNAKKLFKEEVDAIRSLGIKVG